jgi:hypothetical protein
LEGKQADSGVDPRIKYFEEYSKGTSLIMPVVNKIFDGALTLKGYNLSPEACKGIAAYC